ncbi:hypothetical protein D3C76_514220 [compost metagenome]
MRRFAAQVAHLVLLQEIPSSVGAFAQVAQATLLADVHHLLFAQIVQITFSRGFTAHALIDAQGTPRAQHFICPIAQLQRYGIGGGQAFDGPGTHGQFGGLAAHHVLKVDRSHVPPCIAFDFAGIGICRLQPVPGFCQQWPDIGGQFRLHGARWLAEVIFAA